MWVVNGRWAAFVGLLGAIALASGCAGGTGETVPLEDVKGELPDADDKQVAFDALLQDVHLEVSLRGGWFARVSIWSDKRSVVASWWGVQGPILDVGYSANGVGPAWQCQPQIQANSPYPPDSGHCVSLTRKCTCTEDGKRCDCAAELPEVPDNLYVFPSTEMANGGGQEGWNVSEAGVVLPVENASAAVVKFVDFVVPQLFVLCEGDSASFSWVSAEGLDILLAQQFTSEVVLYREKALGYQEEKSYDYGQDFCFQESVPNPGDGLFQYDLSFDSLAPCGTEDTVIFRPTAYREFSTEGRFAEGSFVHAGVASPGFPVEPTVGCGPAVYPPWPGMTGPVPLALTYPSGGPFQPPQYFSGGNLRLLAPLEGGFFVQWVLHKNDYTDWARYLEASGTFGYIQDTPAAIHQAVDGTWVGVSRQYPKVYRRLDDDSWLITEELFADPEEPMPGNDFRMIAVVETEGQVVGLLSNYKEGSLLLLSPLGRPVIPNGTLCPDGGAPPTLTEANIRMTAVEEVDGEPEPTAPSVRLRTVCMKEDEAFALYDTAVELATGEGQTKVAMDWQDLPKDYWEYDLGVQPHCFDDDLVVWQSRTKDGKLNVRAYKAEPGRTAEGLVLEASVPCQEPSPHPEIDRRGDELFVAWPNAASGVPSDAGIPRQPVVARLSLAGEETQVGTLPTPPVRPDHVRAGRDQDGKLHVFAIGAGLETYWYREE